MVRRELGRKIIQIFHLSYHQNFGSIFAEPPAAPHFNELMWRRDVKGTPWTAADEGVTAGQARKSTARLCVFVIIALKIEQRSRSTSPSELPAAPSLAVPGAPKSFGH